MKLKKLLLITMAGAMLLSGCGNKEMSKNAMKIGDNKISVGVIKFVGEYGSNSTDPEYISDVVKQNYLFNRDHT